MVIRNSSDPKSAEEMNEIIKNAKHVFILVYMVGCGPCNATRPEWKKMCDIMDKKYSNDNNVAILDLDSKFMNSVEGLGQIDGFPTIKYITNNGKKNEAYENSNIPNKERSANSFVKWIESKLNKKSNGMPKSVFELSRLLSNKQPNATKTIHHQGIKKQMNKTRAKPRIRIGKKNKKFSKKYKKSFKKMTKKGKMRKTGKINRIKRKK